MTEQPESETESRGFGVSLDSGRREIAPGIHMIQECVAREPLKEPREDERLDWYNPDEELHTLMNAYLIQGEKTLLFDTLTPGARDIVLRHLDDHLGNRSLDYLVVSHPEGNHAGNTGAILERYPDATLVAPSYGAHHDLFHLDSKTKYVADGDSIDLGGRQVDFHKPTFFDHAMTVFMTERQTSTLFTVDWFGYEHIGADCLCFADEQTGASEDGFDATFGQLYRFQGYALVWLRYVNASKTDDAIDTLQDKIDIDVIAPAHGLPIRSDIPGHFELMKEVIREISEDQTDYAIHGHSQLQLARDGSYLGSDSDE